MTDFRVAADAIVKHFNVFKAYLPGVLWGGEAVVMQALRLQRTEETFHRRIAPQG